MTSPFLDDAPRSWFSSGPVVLVIRIECGIPAYFLVPNHDLTGEKRAALVSRNASSAAAHAWLDQFPTLNLPVDGRVLPLHDILPGATIVEIMHVFADD